MDTVLKNDRDAIVKAAEAIDITGLPVWSDLDALAARVQVDKISVEPDSIVVTENGRQFEGVINLYLTLSDDPNGPDAFSSNESFWGTFVGHLDRGQPTVDSVEVDTTKFYS